ncbi:hypothetical protein AVEN_195632-1 [Araneus ventricosus]|uniref:DUF4817 domain-containing protein n=1 Tax=Araneus ventricosus TaxID=182803 RepID=A0A4Y2BBH0_ARAVE|nr:hypothetical protein AVEN_195632-1 [Araneus ventricosus]
MATVQQKARLTRIWFHDSKSIVTVQRRFRLEYRNGLFPSRGGLLVKSRPRDRWAPGSKPDSTEDPSCMEPAAR